MQMDRNTTVVSRFNGFINARDIEGLSAMMTDDHIFIDSANRQVIGKVDCIRAWKGFFAAFPDYQNHFEHVSAHAELIVLMGRTSCSDARLDGAALWSARVRDEQVSEWRVFEDTVSNRKLLGLVGSDRD